MDISQPRESDLGELIALYIDTRDAKEAIVHRHKAHLKKYDHVLGVIEAKLLDHLRKHKVQSLSGGVGTAYLGTRTSASIADPVSFKGYVIENRAWDMLDWKANVTAVEDYLAEHQSLPPGVNLNTRVSVNVMRK